LENEHLRTAITRAGPSPEEFADIVQVDVKTVRRWLAGRTPYPRHRIRVAGALDTTEQALWPSAVPAPTATGAGELGTHATGDAIAGYAHATDSATPNVDELLRAAVERIEIVIPYLGSGPGLVELFRTSAANGCRVRLIIEDPDERVEPLLGVDAIELRASPVGEDHVLFRVDDEMLLVLTRIGFAGTSRPVIHLRRQADDGLSIASPRTSTTAGSRRPRSPVVSSSTPTSRIPNSGPNQSTRPRPTRDRLPRPRGHPRRPPRRSQTPRAAGHDDRPDQAPPGLASPHRGTLSQAWRDEAVERAGV